jgi:hypothetical protein
MYTLGLGPNQVSPILGLGKTLLLYGVDELPPVRDHVYVQVQGQTKPSHSSTCPSDVARRIVMHGCGRHGHCVLYLMLESLVLVLYISLLVEPLIFVNGLTLLPFLLIFLFPCSSS